MPRSIALLVVGLLVGGCYNPDSGHGAGLPDAAPAECDDNDDCRTPTNDCELPGTCDLASHTCQFPPRVCSSLDGPCTVGACVPGTGCVAQPANEDAACAEPSCGPYGECIGFSVF